MAARMAARMAAQGPSRTASAHRHMIAAILLFIMNSLNDLKDIIYSFIHPYSSL